MDTQTAVLISRFGFQHRIPKPQFSWFVTGWPAEKKRTMTKVKRVEKMPQTPLNTPSNTNFGHFSDIFGDAPKERRRRRAEKQLSKRVFLDSPFLLCPLKVFRCSESKPLGGREEMTLQKHPFGQPFLRTTPSPLLWTLFRHFLAVWPVFLLGKSVQCMPSAILSIPGISRCFGLFCPRPNFT